MSRMLNPNPLISYRVQVVSSCWVEYSNPYSYLCYWGESLQKIWSLLMKGWSTRITTVALAVFSTPTIKLEACTNILLAPKNIQPIRSCQVTSRAVIQVQPCDIRNKEVVARKKEEHYMGSYKIVCTISWAVKEKITWTNHMTKRQRIQIQIQKNGQAVTCEVYIRSNQSKQNTHTYIQNQFIILSLLTSTL